MRCLCGNPAPHVPPEGSPRGPPQLSATGNRAKKGCYAGKVLRRGPSEDLFARSDFGRASRVELGLLEGPKFSVGAGFRT